jgi:hypothetical protein
MMEGTVWQHRKGGIYSVLAVALIEATLAEVVVYEAHEDGTVWVRPMDEFLDGRFTQLVEPTFEDPLAFDLYEDLEFRFL